jgi:FMN phosphatase YigB (HAD superfamily)
MKFRVIIFDLGDTLIHQRVDSAVPLDEMSLRLMPHVPEALEALVSMYVLAVLSNTTQTSGEQVKRALKRLGIADYFTAILTSVDLGLEKPHPSVFFQVLDYLCTDPSEAIMIGNDPQHDIVPAQSIGMTAIQFVTSKAAACGSQADATFESFALLPDLIRDVERNLQ